MENVNIAGEWRRPVNTSANQKGGIHDDETASGLGFKGGTVAGSIHMEQFPPLLVSHFGDAWWRTGGLSLYFETATTDGQPVQCHLEAVSDNRARVWMENEAGDRIMAGTASLGEDPESTVKGRVTAARPATDIRMFADVKINTPSERVPSRISAAEVDRQLEVITEPMPCYTDAGIFGGRVLPATMVVHAFRVAEPLVAPIRGKFVGMYGAIEIQHLAGPILADHDYVSVGEALALSESPKTEIIWHQHTLLDADSNEPVARMIKMDRLLKGASPLWNAG